MKQEIIRKGKLWFRFCGREWRVSTILAVVFISIAALLAPRAAAEGTGPAGMRGTAEETAASSHTCYEVFVYSFRDSDGDGTGDLKGVEEQLDYICGQDEHGLGCDMIWLMPVFPSPTYHKYDVTDYREIDPAYGSLQDMQELLAACHKRGVRLILDLPLNHTSTEHPWFAQAAAYLRGLKSGQEPSEEDCPTVGYYNFSREKGTGYEPLEGTEWFYEARFWSGMPDLNLDSEQVREEIRGMTAFWQDLGVDGFRLDAVTSYYTESKEKSIEFVRWLTEQCREKDPDCYLVGEAWVDQASYLQYYASGIDSMFDFAFAGPEGVIAAVTRGSRAASWYGEQLMEEEAQLENYGGRAVNAPFYTNHDMARSAGYYPDDGGARTKFAWCLNLLTPGNAFLYYGEELGMNGSGKDENKRAPMFWSSDPEAEGMCRGPEDMDAVSMTFPALEDQQDDPASVFSCVREAIRLRRRYPAIAGGKTKLVEALSGKEVCALVRTMPGKQAVLLVLNASEKELEVDLSLLDADPEAAGVTDQRGKLSLTPYAIALLGEGEEEWTLLNDGCVLPEKAGRRRR